MKKSIFFFLCFFTIANTFASEVYTCVDGAGYDVLYVIRKSVAKSRARECALAKCYADGNAQCKEEGVIVDRLVLSEEIYYRAKATVIGSN